MASPSSRRAWIEIYNAQMEQYQVAVALLAEGVDRNLKAGGQLFHDFGVALLAEGVDRNSAHGPA